MSDFFRIPKIDGLADAGLATLARLAHQAEDTDDDVLLMNVAAEVEGRGDTATDHFRREYIRLHGERTPAPATIGLPIPVLRGVSIQRIGAGEGGERA